jgi:hypothetical protein
MEFTKNEIAVIEQTVNEQVEVQMRELADLELALIGGGCGDISLG